MTIYTQADKAIDAIIEWFESNQEIFSDCIEELDNYNGYLGDDRYEEMYLLDEIFKGSSEDVTYWLNRAYYGHDENNGDYSSFNPNRDYFRFNGYGNLVSSDWKDYSDFIDRWAIEDMSENRRWIDTIEQYDELAELFDALENASNEEIA